MNETPESLVAFVAELREEAQKHRKAGGNTDLGWKLLQAANTIDRLRPRTEPEKVEQQRRQDAWDAERQRETMDRFHRGGHVPYDEFTR